jgi:integrase
MSVYKKTSPKTGKTSWFCTFYYTDWQGKRKQKKKEGFATKREAAAFERDFIQRAEGSLDMTFGSLYALYKADYKKRVKLSSFSSTTANVEKRVLPYFKDMAINAITPLQVRQWQDQLRQEEELSNTSIRWLHVHLSGIFNFAIKFYKLPTNPAKAAGNVKQDKTVEALKFWTIDQFRQFQQAAQGKEPFYTFFTLLFWTGLREGEALALTIADIDTTANTITVNKTFHRYYKQEVITTPKTAKSIRTVTIPQHLTDLLAEYCKHIAHPSPSARIFETMPYPTAIRATFKRITEAAGLPLIHVHDLRHSHASLLIQQNVPPIVIRDRLGHESIQTTLDIYSHLYPHKEQEIGSILNTLWE